MDDQERMELRPKYGKVVCKMLARCLKGSGPGVCLSVPLGEGGATGWSQQFNWEGRVSLSLWEEKPTPIPRICDGEASLYSEFHEILGTHLEALAAERYEMPLIS